MIISFYNFLFGIRWEGQSFQARKIIISSIFIFKQTFQFVSFIICEFFLFFCYFLTLNYYFIIVWVCFIFFYLLSFLLIIVKIGSVSSTWFIWLLWIYGWYQTRLNFHKFIFISWTYNWTILFNKTQSCLCLNFIGHFLVN